MACPWIAPRRRAAAPALSEIAAALGIIAASIVYRGGDGQGVLAPEQYERLVEEMEAHHQGARNAGRPMLLEGGLDWKPMGFSPSDMEFHETKLAAAREIAQAFGVPPMLIGIPGDATYANYAEAHRAFYRLTVLPLATRVAASLGWFLSEHLGEVLRRGEGDPEDLPHLRRRLLHLGPLLLTHAQACSEAESSAASSASSSTPSSSAGRTTT